MEKTQNSSILTTEILEKLTDKQNVLSTLCRGENILPKMHLNFAQYCNTKADLTVGNIVNISQLYVNKVSNGKVFLCRTITPENAIANGMVQMAVEDPSWKVVGLILCNHLRGNGKDLHELIIPQGVILALQNPFLQYDGENLVVICANPAFLEFISLKTICKLFPDIWENNSSIWAVNDDETALNLKALGNKSFQSKRWADALRFYDLSLEYFPQLSPERTTIICNKAAAFLNLGCYNQALLSCNDVLKHDNANCKATFRKGKALIGLQQYENAFTFLSDCLEQESLKTDKELIKLTELANNFMKEVSTCEIDELPLSQLVISFLSGGNVDTTSIPEMIGPIEVANMEGRGQGYIATKDINTGQILICAKSFGYATITQEELQNTQFLQTHKIPGHDGVVTEIANKIAFEPKLAEEFYKLWAGDELKRLTPTENTGTEGIDTGSASAVAVDLQRIDMILQMNGFGFNSQGDYTGIFNNGCGLWILPSYLNHSCDGGNSLWDIFGNVMIVRAAKKIQKGEEILISYVNPAENLKTRQHCFQLHEFICDCPLCTFELSEPPQLVEERSKIFQWLAENLDLCARSPEVLNKSLGEMHKLVELRRDTPKMNSCLGSHIIISLMGVFFSTGRFKECLHYLKKVFAVVKSVSPASVGVAVNILRCHMALQDRENVLKWTEFVKKLLKSRYGTAQAIQALTPETVQDLKFFGIDFFTS